MPEEETPAVYLDGRARSSPTGSALLRFAERYAAWYERHPRTLGAADGEHPYRGDQPAGRAGLADSALAAQAVGTGASAREPRLRREGGASGDDQQGDVDRKNERGAARLVEVPKPNRDAEQRGRRDRRDRDRDPTAAAALVSKESIAAMPAASAIKTVGNRSCRATRVRRPEPEDPVDHIRGIEQRREPAADAGDEEQAEQQRRTRPPRQCNSAADDAHTRRRPGGGRG